MEKLFKVKFFIFLILISLAFNDDIIINNIEIVGLITGAIK